MRRRGIALLFWLLQAISFRRACTLLISNLAAVEGFVIVPNRSSSSSSTTHPPSRLCWLLPSSTTTTATTKSRTTSSSCSSCAPRPPTPRSATVCLVSAAVGGGAPADPRPSPPPTAAETTTTRTPRRPVLAAACGSSSSPPSPPPHLPRPSSSAAVVECRKQQPYPRDDNDDEEKESWPMSRNAVLEWVDDIHRQSSTKCTTFEIEKLLTNTATVPDDENKDKNNGDCGVRSSCPLVAFQWVEGSGSMGSVLPTLNNDVAAGARGRQAEQMLLQQPAKMHSTKTVIEATRTPQNDADSHISGKVKKKIAIRTMDYDDDDDSCETRKQKPLLDSSSVMKIRDAAHQYWNDKNNPSGSRFTLQFSQTNSECHLDELVRLDQTGTLKRIVNELLEKKIYPLIRNAFTEQELGQGQLCVYDSLVIRYDGNSAKEQYSASQPLHRDGGIVSVNIALNSQKEFEGGGTFFENLIDSPYCKDPIVHPMGVGHAIAHLSTERHAGAPTTKGVREILVFFLTLRQPRCDGLVPYYRAPPIERAFHLKLAAKELAQQSQSSLALMCLDLALEEKPLDGEAHFWKGFWLFPNVGNSNIDYNKYRDQDDCDFVRNMKLFQQSIHHMEKAQECSPFDARIHCYAGIAYKRMVDFFLRHNNTSPQQQQEMHDENQMFLESSVVCFEKSMYLHQKYQQLGISSDFDVVVAILSLSEVLSRLKRYKDALGYIAVLESHTQGSDQDTLLDNDVKKHASKLSQYCQEQLQLQYSN